MKKLHLPPLLLLVSGTFMFGFAVGAALSKEYWIGLMLLWTGSVLFIVGAALLDRADSAENTIKQLRMERNEAVSDIEQILAKGRKYADDERAVSTICKAYCTNYGKDCFEYSRSCLHCCDNFNWKGTQP